MITAMLFLLVSCAKNSVLDLNRSVPLQKENSIRVSSSTTIYLPPGMISLTYDDGPGPATLALARYLHEQHICATFFVVGNTTNGQAGYINNPILDSLIFYGHRIGNHTFNHLDLPTLSCPETNYQIRNNQANIDPVIKNNLCYFRPPWLDWSVKVTNCVVSDQTIDNLRGPIAWNFETFDYGNRESLHPEAIAQTFLNDVNNAAKFNSSAGGVILMHDFNSYTVPDFALRETKVIVPLLKSKGYTFVSPTLEFSPFTLNLCPNNEFSDIDGWASDIGYYGTIRLADVNGDGMADLIGRGKEGIYVALSTGVGFGPSKLWAPEFSDRHGWKPPEYSTTIQCADVDGDGQSDIIIRSPIGIQVSLSTGHSFQHSTLWSSQFSNTTDQTWSKNVGYYGTFRAADVNGDHKADLIARGPKGVYVCLSTGNEFKPAVLWNKEFSDGAGWKPAEYSTTIQVADVNGDGMADLVGRGPAGILVSLSKGSGFLPSTLWSGYFSDKAGWGSDVAYYGAIRLADVNGDGNADLVVRGNDGVRVALSNGHAFMPNTVWTDTDFTDKMGWKPKYYSLTFQCGDVNGDKRADIVGRANRGITGAFAP